MVGATGFEPATSCSQGRADHFLAIFITACYSVCCDCYSIYQNILGLLSVFCIFMLVTVNSGGVGDNLATVKRRQLP